MKISLLFALLLFQITAHASLTQSEAIERRKQVKSVSYSIDLTFKKMSPEFQGNVTLDIEFNDISKPLRVELRAKEIIGVSVNGKALQGIKSLGDHFYLPANALSNKTTVNVRYVGLKVSGEFVSHTDPDGSEYFYSHLEPYGAHQIFPCFDQPDIKATYELKVTAPSHWKIIANELASSITPQKDLSLHKFPKTPILSTYLFFVGGGDFVEWKDSHNGLPLLLYSRKSLSANVDAEEIFRITKIGLDFYSKYFDYPMPFSKYGQVFVPNFTSMGMENPGAVTLNERYIFSSKPVDALYLKRAELIFHELAHMWFGNLVTMKWWDDLWLNEAFASYFAGVGLKVALNKPTSDLYFQVQKYGAYKEDEYSTSHPVMSDVPDALSAFASFDSITYSKGSAVLKQLHNLVGDEVFRKGLSFYFKTYAFKNTLFSDFLQSFEKFYGKSLSGWAAIWLQTRGVNSISSKFSCKDGKLSSFSILMAPSADNNFYPRKSNFGFYKIKNGSVEKLFIESFEFNSKETSFPNMAGKSCPDFVFPNEGDNDYGIYSLDQNSIKHVKTILARHPDMTSRYMLWNILAYSVREGNLTVEQFLEAGGEALKQEENGELLTLVTGLTSNSKQSAIRDVFNIFANNGQREQYSKNYESIVFNRLLNLPKNHDLKQVFYELFALIAQSKLGQERIIDYLERNKKGTAEFNQDTRWRLLVALGRNNHPKAFELAEKEFAIDRTESGERNFFGVKTSIPDLKHRKEMWENFMSPGKFSMVTAYDSAEYVHTPNHPEMSLPFMQRYFDYLSGEDWIRNNGFANHYFHRFYPTYVCSPEMLKMSQEAFKKAQRLSPRARNRWTQVQEELEICVQRKFKASY